MTCINLPHSLSACARYAWRAADRFGRFCLLAFHHRYYLGVMALVTVLSVMNGFERELQNNILGLMPQAILSAKQGSVNPQQLPEREAKPRA